MSAPIAHYTLSLVGSLFQKILIKKEQQVSPHVLKEKIGNLIIFQKILIKKEQQGFRKLQFNVFAEIAFKKS